MNKKKMIIITIIFILMLIPIKDKLWDGGSTEYRAILYKVTKIHKLNASSSTGYEDGLEVKILGIKVYSVTNTYVEATPKITLKELESIQKEVDDSIAKYRETNEYNNFASSGVDESKQRVIIELINNSKENQKWFKDNIYNSEYIMFTQGGPYYAY